MASETDRELLLLLRTQTIDVSLMVDYTTLALRAMPAPVTPEGQEALNAAWAILGRMLERNQKLLETDHG